MALELDVFVLCRRDQQVVEAFLDRYADPDELRREYSPSGHPPSRERLAIALEPPLPRDAVAMGGHRWPEDDDRFPGWLEVPVRTQREAVALGLAHPDWAFVQYLPAAAAAPTDQCCIAFTRDGHAILGLTLVDPGSAADDEREVDPVAVLERLVAELDARAGFIGWEVTPFESAQEFEEMLRGERGGGVSLDLPRWLHGRWLSPQGV